MMGFMVLFWAAVVGGIVWLFSSQSRRPETEPGRESALEILKKRYARGEIGKEEYERMRQEITGG